VRAGALGLCLCSALAGAQPRVPFAFDAGLAAEQSLTQQKLNDLLSRLPAGFVLPASFQTLQSAPDNVAPPTTTLWFAPEVQAQAVRAADAGTTPLVFPPSVACASHLAFSLPSSALLASGAASGCTAEEASVRSQLAAANVSSCIEVAEPERYVTAYQVPSNIAAGTTQLQDFVDQRTNTLEQQIGLAGAGLALQPIPAGLLPSDWFPTLRTILWKLRATAIAARISSARGAYASALSTLNNQAACFDATQRATLVSQVQQLDAELASLETRIQALQSQGTAKAAQQAQCLAARSRTRPTLPLPALTDEEREFIGFWLGGVYWRMRGGGVLTLGSTQKARQYFARRPFREIGRLSNGTSTGDKAADALWCNLGDGWGSWMDMGTTTGSDPEDGHDAYYDLVQMTNRGRQQVADFPSAATALCVGQGVFNVSQSPEKYLRDDGYDTQALVAGGLQMGPCYLYALNPLKSFVYYPSASAPAPYNDLIGSFTASGEFCIGAAMGLGLTRSFLNGKPNGLAPATFCSGRVCGPDLCGTSCGTCAGGMSCDAAGQCVSGGSGGGAGGSGGAGGTGGAGGNGGSGGTGGSGGSGGTGGSGGSGGAGGATGGGSGGTGGTAGGGGSGGGSGGTGGGDPTSTDGGAGAGGGPGVESPSGCGCNASTHELLATLAVLLARFRRRTRR
jgi:hypothetical protein